MDEPEMVKVPALVTGDGAVNAVCRVPARPEISSCHRRRCCTKKSCQGNIPCELENLLPGDRGQNGITVVETQNFDAMQGVKTLSLIPDRG